MLLVAMCTVVLSMPVRDHADAMATCLYVGETANRYDAPESLIISLAWHESRFVWKAKSPKGAIGPLQVMPYWMEKSKDEVDAGLVAWWYWRNRSITNRVAVAKYNAGYKPGKRSYAFSDRVIGLSNKLMEATVGVSNVD